MSHSPLMRFSSSVVRLVKKPLVMIIALSLPLILFLFQGPLILQSKAVVESPHVEPPQYLNGWSEGDGGSIAVGEDGRVYVSTSSGELLVFDSDGVLLDTWTGFNNTGYDMKIAVEGDRVYVANFDGVSSYDIVVFDTDGNDVTDWSADGYVYDIAVDYLGYVYVLYEGNYFNTGMVAVFDPDGSYITDWDTGCWNGGIAADSSSNVYVSCMASEPAVKKFTSEGTLLTSWGTIGGGESQFAWPAGIATDTLGNVYIADASNERIQKFASSGAFLTMWGEWGRYPGQMDYPGDVAIGPDRNIYVYGGDGKGDGIVQIFGYSSLITAGYASADRAVSPTDPGFLDEYGMSFVEDGAYWITDLSEENGGYDSQIFKLFPDVSGINEPTFEVAWVGHGDEPTDKLVYVSIWNFETSAWEELGSQHCGEDCTLAGTRTGAAYQDGDGYVWVWARADNDYETGPVISKVAEGYLCGWTCGQGMSWETDVPSTTQVAIDSVSHEIGTWDDYGMRSVLVQDLTLDHYVFPTLSTGTWYFRVRSCDENNNCSTSEEYSMDYVHDWGDSCPFIYSYDGSGYEFHVDASGSGLLGAGLDRETWAETPFYKQSSYYPLPLSYTWLSSESLVARSVGGETFYDIRNTTELNEVNYYDEAALFVIDHSSETEVYPDYRENGQFHSVMKGAGVPVSVVDQGGNDVSAVVSANDGVYFHSALGVDPAYVDIKLSEAGTTPEHLKLVIERSKEANAGGDRNSDKLQYKSGGVFVDVPSDYNIFSTIREGAPGVSKIKSSIYGTDTKVIDLSGLQIEDNMIRLVMTNKSRQWDIDWIAVDTSADENMTVTELKPYFADLHYYGVSGMVPTAPDDPLMTLTQPVYGRLAPYTPAPLSGMATRYGDVTDLLAAVDNQFVVMTQGDEISFRYVVPAQELGSERDFMYKVFDYHKSYTGALGDAIDPLPFEGMSQYPYHTDLENYPYALNQSYLDTYNTREINWPAEETNLEPNVSEVTTTSQEVHRSLNTDYLGLTVSDTTPPEGTLTGLPTGPISDPTPEFHGTATEESGIVVSVEFRTDGGSWKDCTADDGVFDEAVEMFTCRITSSLSNGSHVLDIQALDSNGNQGLVLSAYTLTVNTGLADTGASVVLPMVMGGLVIGASGVEVVRSSRKKK